MIEKTQIINCPRCGGHLTLRHHARRPGVFFWMCDSEPPHFCIDENGVPGRVLEDKAAEMAAAPKDTCPTCREVTMRLESSKSPGRFFWVCEHKHYHADSDGVPGHALG